MSSPLFPFRPLSLLLAAATLDAHAADAPAVAAPVEKVEVVGGKKFDERKESTAAKIVVNHEEIVRFGDSTLADVLKRLPGITVGGVQGRGGEIRMRGLGNGYTQILLNGEPTPAGFSLDSISPDLIERIEILRAASAEFSTQAIAGTINIVLKKAVQRDAGEIKASLASENGRVSPGINAQLSRRAGALSYTLAGAVSHTQFADREVIEDVGSDAQAQRNLLRRTPDQAIGSVDTINFAPRLNWNLDSGDTLTSQSFLNYRRVDSEESQLTTTVLGDPPSYSSNVLRYYSKAVTARSNVNWIHKLGDEGKLDIKFGVSYNQRDSEARFNAYDEQALYILDRLVVSGATDKGYTLSGKYATPLAQDNVLALGWDGEYSERGENRLQHDISATDLRQANASRQYLDIDESYDARVRRLALFAQDEWTITPRWSIYMGLRWEGLDTRSAGNVLSEVHNRSGVWSPLVQTLWKLPDTKNDQVRLGLTRTYKAPTTANLMPRRYVSINNSATNPDGQGNPNLRPELAWGLDAAYEHYLGDAGLISASVFARRIEDVTVKRLIQNGAVWISVPVNDGNANTRGFELDAKLRLRDWAKTLPAVDLRANLTRSWSSIDNVPGPDNRLDQQTPISANLGIDCRLDGIPLTLGANFGYQDGGPVRLSTTQSAYTIPKRSLDAYGLWKFDARTQLRLGLANMLHQDNVAVASYFDGNGTLNKVTNTQTSVAVKATLEVKY